MLRELVDIAVLEDFAAGLARACGLRVALYSLRRDLIAVSPLGSAGGVARLLPEKLPPQLEWINLMPAPEPPAGVAFVEDKGYRTIVVPVHVRKSVMGFVGVGAFRVPARGGEALGRRAAGGDPPTLRNATEVRAVNVARWASRMLAGWCLNEARLDAAAGELSLLGDISELLSGQEDLRRVLDRIVVETARVMNVSYCSLRLYNPRTEELTVEAGYNVLETADSEQTILRCENPIDDLALQGRLVYIEDAARDPRVRFAEEARRLGIVSGLAAGMMYRGEALGVLRVYANHKKRFRSQHRSLLRAVAAHAAIAVVNARLLEERLRSIATERQLFTAGQVQARMVRTPPPEHPRVDSALVFEPSSHVGGDFGDVFKLADGRLLAVVGDVVGHGVPAALLMASARAALRASAAHFENLADLLAQLNDHIYRETTSSEFVTLLLVGVAPDAGRLHYVNAGHEPLLLLRDGQVQCIDNADLVLGVELEQRYEQHTLDLCPGDFILLYTDGVVEAMNFEDKPFGRRQLHNAMRQYGTLAPDQALRNIRWDVRRFVGLAEQSDDLTMVGLRIR